MKAVFTNLIVFVAFFAVSAAAAPQEGKTLLLMGLEAKLVDESGEVSGEDVAFLRYQLRNIETNEVHTIENTGKGYGLIEVTPGRYCLDFVEVTETLALTFCDIADFPANAGELVNVGYWVFELGNIDSDDPHVQLQRVLARRFELVDLAKQEYADKYKNYYGEQTFVAAAEPSVKNTIWYGRDLEGDQMMFRFYKSGKFEVVYQDWTTLAGRFKQKGNRIRAYAGKTGSLKNPGFEFEGDLVDGRILGSVDNLIGSKWFWEISVNPFDMVPPNTTDRLRLYAFTDAEYPTSAFKKGREGWVKLRYRVPLSYSAHTGFKQIHHPVDIEVVESNPMHIFDEAAILMLQKRLYALPVIDGELVETEIEETIKFEIDLSNKVKVTGFEDATDLLGNR
ncbi:MAG: energy transducer TonB [Gammaproteobacteria bacterium]|nr:energy transducer TonB [Gammaproteobacteria bacterium]